MSAPVKIRKPLEIYRGDTLTRTFTVGELNDEGILIPVNLTSFGNSWTAQLRSTENSIDDIDLIVDISLLTLGKITIILDSVKSQNVPNKGVWDIQVANTSVTPHIVKTLIRGEFVLIKDVTRP